MSNAFSGYNLSMNVSAITTFEITPDDSNDLAQVTIALNTASPETIRVTTADGSISDVSIHPGYAFPLRVRRVWLTGTLPRGLSDWPDQSE